MKKHLICLAAVIIAVYFWTSSTIKDIDAHYGISLEAEPLNARGSFIQILVSPTQDDKSIEQATVERVDEDTVDVKIDMVSIKEGDTQKAQTVQIYILTEENVRFIVNDTEQNVYYHRDGIFWKAEG